MRFTHSPIGDCAEEDRPYLWLGDLLIAVAIVAVCSVVYFWGVA